MDATLPSGNQNHLSTPEFAATLDLDVESSDIAAVNMSAVENVAAHIRRDATFLKYERYGWDDPRFWYPEGDPAQRSQYFAVGNAINFRFWRILNRDVIPAAGFLDGERHTGAMYMWRCLRRCLDRGDTPLFSAAFLASISVEQFERVFSDDSGKNPLDVALEDRVANLRNLGQRLEAAWAGQFHNVITSARGSLRSFVRASSTFRAFDDPLFKLTMVNTILHLGSRVAAFDADPLPGIDYHLLKQALRQGLVVPSPAIAEKLRDRRFLSSIEGYHLRRIALLAFVELSRRTGLSGELLDNKWWWNRLKCRTADPVCLSEATAHECPFYGPCAQHTGYDMPLELTRYY